MSESTAAAEAAEKLKAWVKQKTEDATYQFMDQGLYQSPSIESRDAWVLPYTLIIGQIREGGQDRTFDWFITGDAPLTRTPSSSAATPREAARHFALQWQLDAARQGADGEKLVRQAEALYELTRDDELWKTPDTDHALRQP